MSGPTDSAPTFSVAHDAAPTDALVAGFSTYGLAGLTAVDYLVDHLELRETGHVKASGVPSITPFEQGRPRRPIRLYSRADLDLTVLASEAFVPPTLGEPMASSLSAWAEAGDVSDVTVLSGVPIPHGPDAHRAFHVATDGYRERRLADGSVPPMEGGFLDGVTAALLERGMDSSLGVGVLITPVHAQAPDVEAAVRLVEAVDATHDLGVDAGPLEAFAEEIRRYYEGLAERIEEREPEAGHDRMYM